MIKITLIDKNNTKILGEYNLKVSPSGIKIGRSNENNIIIEDEYVSRNHALIYYRNGNYYIKDLGSKNGTIINNRKIIESVINNGDIIEIGDYRLKFNIISKEFSLLSPLNLVIISSFIFLIILVIFLSSPRSLNHFSSAIKNSKSNVVINRKPINSTKAEEIYKKSVKNLGDLFKSKFDNNTLKNLINELEQAKKYDSTNDKILKSLISLRILNDDLGKSIDDINYLYQKNSNDPLIKTLKFSIDEAQKEFNEIKNLYEKIQNIGD